MKHIRLNLNNIVILTLLMIIVFSCKKKDYPEQPDFSISLSKNTLAFFQQAQADTIFVTSNTVWYVNDPNVNWFTIRPYLEGYGDGMIIITVGNYDGDTNRISEVKVTTDCGLMQPFTVKQNGHNNSALIGIWGMERYTRWNTDYNNNIIPESYEESFYNPYDTTAGFQMYYLENNTGWQVSYIIDETGYFPFDYSYYPELEKLLFSFDTYDPNAPENYEADMLTLNDSVMIFKNEFRSHWFEKAEMVRIGAFDDSVKRALPRITPYRKAKDSPIFEF